MNAINQIDEVIECHHVTYSGDFVLKAIAADMLHQKLMLEKVSDISVVDNLVYGDTFTLKIAK